MLGLQFALVAASAGVPSRFVSLRDGPLMTAGRIDRWASRSGRSADDLPLTIRSDLDFPHAWTIGYPDRREGPDPDLLVVDDIDAYDHHDGRGPDDPTGYRATASALPEYLRDRAIDPGVPIVVTRPTAYAPDASGREVSDPWLRAADVVVRIDRRTFTHPSPTVVDDATARLTILRNRFGPQATIEVAIAIWGGLVTPEQQSTRV